MTVSSQTNKVIYIGNGVAKEFAIPFSFLEQEHLKVRQKKNDIQTERTDWTVKSGNLVFADAPESGAEIAIVREVPLTQETDYRDNEILHAETLERNFDKLTMQVQQLAEKSARAVTVDIFDDTQADSLIPSIRKAVSDCTAFATTVHTKAQEAEQTAQNAANSAQAAALSEQSTAAMLSTKADKNVYASKTVRGVALWADSQAVVSETRPACVVESFKSGFCWYRVWSDGWIEQGGITVEALPLITFLKPFATADYQFSKCLYRYGETALSGQPVWEEFREYNRTTTGIQLYITNSAIQVAWTACGYGV